MIGECFNGNDDELQGAIIQLIHEELEPLLIGRSVAGHRGSLGADARRHRAVPARPAGALRAQACVDSALHDAVGKLTGLPLHVLWGRATRDVKTVALGGYYRERNELRASPRKSAN